MKTHTNRPSWHTKDHDSTWEKVKAAFRRDWEQTKHDFGSDSARDPNQDMGDTVKQMSGKQKTTHPRNFEDAESAFEYGHAARHHYHSEHPKWNSELDKKLAHDYHGDWERDRPYVRHAYERNYKI